MGTTVKAARFSRFGKPQDVVELVDLPDPGPPGEGEVLIDMEACPINPADLLQFEGRYGAEPPPLPVFPGGEGVGIVRELGAAVAHLKVGDRVLLLFAGRGNWRTRMKAKASSLFPLPPADPLQLAMLTVNPATAQLMLTQFVTLQPGDWVIQNAANSGVGRGVIALARVMGLRTVNVVRRAELAPALASAGADQVIVDGPELPSRVAAITGKQGRPRLGIDAVAGHSTLHLAESLTDSGVIVNYGMLSGTPCTVGPGDLIFRDISLRGFWLSRWFATASPEERRETYSHLTALVAKGAIHVPVEATYPLSDIADALGHAAREGRDGKVLLTA